MKKLLSFVVILIFMFVGIGVVFASPFIHCAPQTGVIGYVITGDAYFPDQIAAQADGSAKIDVATIPVGVHSLQVSACCLWGCSDKAPLSFTKFIPNAPVGLEIVK
jgi:hypothetical protein